MEHPIITDMAEMETETVGGYARLGKQLSQRHINDLVDRLELIFRFIGMGIGTGCELVAGDGCITIREGVINAQSLSATREVTEIFPPDYDRFVWIDDRSAILFTTDKQNPAAYVCVGHAKWIDGQIVVDDDGRMETIRWEDRRAIIGRGALIVNTDIHGIGIGKEPEHAGVDSAHPITAAGIDLIPGDHPENKPGVMQLYVAYVDDTPELHVNDHAGNVIQLTNGGVLTPPEPTT